MRPTNLKTKLFLDSGDPNDTRSVLDSLGFLDGQTTNPSLVTKNPRVKQLLDNGEKITKEELLNHYHEIVKEISSLIPDGSVSIEVYADASTTAAEMLEQAEEMFAWIANAHIKFPTTKAGLEAAEMAVAQDMRVNMTLCFTQEQAAAVYAATKAATKPNQVFVSPFMGRLDDKGVNGFQVVKNIAKMYEAGDRHVKLLAASVRNMEHFNAVLSNEIDIITSPVEFLLEWAKNGSEMPLADYNYYKEGLSEVEYQELDLTQNWRDFDLYHELTETGQKKFAEDWNALIK